jgi:hypothetical protein
MTRSVPKAVLRRLPIFQLRILGRGARGRGIHRQLGPDATSAALTSSEPATQRRDFPSGTMGKAEAFFAIGASGYVRIYPTVNFRKAVHPVLAACGDHF